MRTPIPSLAGVAALVLSSCGVLGSGGDASTRTVLVDHVDDEVVTAVLDYFPSDVEMHPGETVVFRQEWSGEAHTVTMGTMVDDMMNVITPLIEKYGHLPDEEIPPDVFPQLEEAMSGLPWLIGENNQVQQNAAQPCYRKEGGPPEDPQEPCPDDEQEQPEFDGTYDFYNSGFIPYQGEQGNEFTLELADDIEPGTYNYYCNLHGPFMAGTVTVVPPDQETESQAEVARRGREEIKAAVAPALEAFRGAESGDDLELEGRKYQKPLAGWASDEITNVHTIVSEFIPRDIAAEVGEPVTWQFVQGHTVSFNVPTYFAPFEVEDDGTVVFTPEAHQPVDSPPLPEGPSGPPGEGPPPEPPAIDRGEWDGRGFMSSGLMWVGSYTVTFTRPGTYQYACLIHPEMVGRVEVE